MSTEIANLIENLLKKDNNFIILDYSRICFEYITNDIVISYRKKYNVLDMHMIK